MIGKSNYEILQRIKKQWDKNNIFNPNKIVNTPAMNTYLRYADEDKEPLKHRMSNFNTYFRFSKSQDFLQSAELCNGSGDCRKSNRAGGTMCPSYRATRDEKDTTRARANILREMISTRSIKEAMGSQEVYDVMDLCLSCKACQAECPSNVDISMLKSEFLQHYYQQHGTPLRTKLIGHVAQINALSQPFAPLYNFLLRKSPLKSSIKSAMGFAKERSLPRLYSDTLQKIYQKGSYYKTSESKKRVFLFCDEFTNYNDVPIGKDALELLERLGYSVVIPRHLESGRAFLSKGLLKKAKWIANKNIAMLSKVMGKDDFLIGIEPSAILSLRDEYPKLATPAQSKLALGLAKNTYLIDEFLAAEYKAGNISPLSFHKESKKIAIHGHCHQKALSSISHTEEILNIPENYQTKIIPSGCCGMAGSFGYEKEHYAVSKKIANSVLIPFIKGMPKETVIAATGTSCRHQIYDMAGMCASHPVTILRQALN